MPWYTGEGSRQEMELLGELLAVEAAAATVRDARWYRMQSVAVQQPWPDLADLLKRRPAVAGGMLRVSVLKLDEQEPLIVFRVDGAEDATVVELTWPTFTSLAAVLSRYLREGDMALRGAIGGHVRWARTRDRTAATAPARRAATTALDGRLVVEYGLDRGAADFERRLASARSAHFARLARRGALARKGADDDD